MKSSRIIFVSALLFAVACGSGGDTDDDGGSAIDGGGSGDGGGGGNGDGGGPVVDAGPAGPDAYIPPAGTPLANRLTVTPITVPNGVKAGVSNWRIWGSTSLRISPVFTVPVANGETLIGYTGQDGTARAVRLSSTGVLLTTHTLGASRELRGLAAEPDGHFGALLWDDPNDKIYLHRFMSNGTEVWADELQNTGSGISGNIPDTFSIGEARLEFGGDRYGATYHVHTPAQGGHEGDTLKYITTAGVESTAYAWGCSHSMSALLRYSTVDAKFLPVCVTDCYPGTTGTPFSTTSIGGIYINNSRKVIDVNAGCNGRVAGELGGAAVAPSGWMIAFNAHQNAATPGQTSYNASTMNQDVAIVPIATSFTPGSVVWLTSTPGNEADVAIERWTPSGESIEQYVVGWSEPGATYGYKLARVSAAGSILEGPVDISATAAWGRRDDPMRAHVDGDIVWAWFPAAGSTTLNFARLESGQ